MTTRFQTPGTPASPSGRSINIPTPSGVINPSLVTARLGSFPATSGRQASKQIFAPVSGGINVQVRVTGIEVAARHWDAFQALLPGYMWVTQNRTGELMTTAARNNLLGASGLKPAFQSGITFASVHHFVSTSPNSVTVSVGPTTFYAPFIEYGLATHAGIGPRPFMTHAAFSIIPGLVQAYADLAAVAAHGAAAIIKSPRYKHPLEKYLRKWRKWLYDREKAIGNITPFSVTGLGGLGLFRTQMLGMARGLGDLNAVITRTIGMRFQRRLVGQFTGRAIGIGSRTIFINKSVNVGFSPAQRGYNLIAGKQVSQFINQSNFLSGR